MLNLTMTEIVKSTGEAEEFSADKVYRSLENAGAKPKLAGEIANKVSEQARKFQTTNQLHEYVFDTLKEQDRPLADRYNLKRAILALGPSGFPFEKYIGKLFVALNYHVKLNVVMQGKCVTHEVDVLLERDGKHSPVEAKFHNSTGLNTNVKVPLYVKSRFDDLKEGVAGKDYNLDQMWVVTNTKFSPDALTYGLCVNLKLLAWDYPFGEGLAKLIDKHGLHPITALSLTNHKQQQRLIGRGVVLASQVAKADAETRGLMRECGLDGDKQQAVIAEARSLVTAG